MAQLKLNFRRWVESAGGIGSLEQPLHGCLGVFHDVGPAVDREKLPLGRLQLRMSRITWDGDGEILSGKEMLGRLIAGAPQGGRDIILMRNSG